MNNSNNTKKYFRFNPSTYNTSSRIVKNVHYGNTIFMANGDVQIEYTTESEILLFFTRLQIHTPTPDDIEPPIDAKEVCNRKRTDQTRLLIFIIQVLAIIGIAVYLLIF